MASVNEAPAPTVGGQQPGTLLEWLGQRWEGWLDIWHVLRPMRFPLVILIVAAPFLALLQQSQDALLALIEDAPGHRSATLLFILMWFSWAFSTFYWARFMSRLPAGPPPPRRYVALIVEAELQEWNRVLPHRFGGAVIALVAFALIAANCTLTTRTIIIDAAIVLVAGWLCRYLPRPLGRTLLALVVTAQTIASCGLFASWASDREWWDQKLTKSAIIILVALVLWWAYRRVVANRRDWMRVLHRHIGGELFSVDAEFRRDLKAPDAVSPGVRWALAGIAAVTALVFLLSAFWQLPFASGIAIVLSLSWLTGAILFLRRSLELPPSTEAVVVLHLAVAWCIFVLSLHSANTVEWFSSPVIFMAVFALWVFGGTFLLAYPAALTGLPTTTALLVFAALMTMVGNRDNHFVRLENSDSATSGTPVQAAFADWAGKAKKAWTESHHTGPVPLVIIATAGGASRAGYWTTRLLTDFEQRMPGFHNYVFAISSVSGGSLGAGIYRAMLNQLPDNPLVPANGKAPAIANQSCDKSEVTRENFARCGIDAVQKDFLSPTFLTGLFADLTQRVLPGALLPDRGTALEGAWEAATERWPNLGFASNFHAFWPAGRKDWLPALLINGTSAKTGRRIITSNLAIADTRCYLRDPKARKACDPSLSAFPDAIDFFGWMKREVRFSTAIHNSARFPYIDAAGTLRRDDGPVDRIIDGGYFENFGAATVFDLVEALRQMNLLQAAPPGKQPTLALFVIQISSDPGIEEPAERDAKLRNPTNLPLGDVVTPLEGFYNVRDGLGTRATRVLQKRIEQPGSGDFAGRYFHFRLYDTSEPMSWALSDAAARKLYEELPEASRCATNATKPSASCQNLRTYCDFIASAGFANGADCATKP